MQGRNRANILLVEILIALLFFMLSSTVLIRLFVAAKTQSHMSLVGTEALAEAQNVLDTLKASEKPEEELKNFGFESAHGVWVRDNKNYVLRAETTTHEFAAGQLWSCELAAYYNRDTELFSLNAERYWGDAK